MTAAANTAPRTRKGGPRLMGRSERIVAALDVGTSKVAAIIANVDANGAARVIGSGLRASNGLKRGLVADMGRTDSAIRAAMMQAENSAGVQVESVLVNLSAGDLSSDTTSVEIDIGGNKISESDLNALRQAGRQQVEEKLNGRNLLHAKPALYTIDGLEGVIDNPLGFHAERLAVDIHVITSATPPIRNLDLVVRRAHLGVEEIMASGVASSISVLNDEERELGVALVEIGAGVTTIALHYSGILVDLATIPMGAFDITADIASTFATRRATAERLKTLSGAATASPRDNHDMLDVDPLDPDDGQEMRRISRADLITVIRDRLKILFHEINRTLLDMGFQGPHGRQVVLTGGGAELRGIAEFAQSTLNRNVRIGRPRGLAGLPDAQSTAAFATITGLVLHAAMPTDDLVHIPARGAVHTPGRATNPFTRLFQTLKSQI